MISGGKKGWRDFKPGKTRIQVRLSEGSSRNASGMEGSRHSSPCRSSGILRDSPALEGTIGEIFPEIDIELVQLGSFKSPNGGKKGGILKEGGGRRSLPAEKQRWCSIDDGGSVRTKT